MRGRYDLDRQRLVLGRKRLAFLVYVDNIGIMGTDEAEVNAAMVEVEAALNTAGLTTHETELAACAAEALGLQHTVRGERRVVSCTDKRYWRLYAGLGWLLGRRSISGKQVEIVVGQRMFVGLLRRESISVFNACYKFIQSTGRASRLCGVR